VTEVVGGLHWVDGIAEAKVYLWLEGDGAIIVDASMPGRARTVLSHLASLGLSAKAVAGIWLTHAHIDHIGSVHSLQEATGAPVVAHEADASSVEGRRWGQIGYAGRSQSVQRLAAWTARRVIRYQGARVGQAVREGDRLGGWQIMHAPGHTAGSVCFYHPERRIAMVGDAINHRRGRLGAPPPVFSTDMAQAYASIRKLATLEVEVCCFGHGPPLTGDARARIQELAGRLP
jgi:glyoxylase-like metal-dependent hydrolase (beta-lactamase superfamily II)